MMDMDTLIKLGGLFLVTGFFLGFTGAMMPGTLLAVTINESIRRGPKAGPLIVLGHAILEAALVAALVYGLAGFLANPRVIAVVSLAGGAVMGWMGWDMARSAKTLSLSAAVSDRRTLHPVAAGIVVSLSNPYWTLWWATTGLACVVMAKQFGRTGILVFFTGHILSDFAWYTFVSAGVAKGRNLMPDRIYRSLAFGCGIVLIGFAFWFVRTGIAKLSP
jgi:threonine/homoserine/homoserine lactone efflux protein